MSTSPNRSKIWGRIINARSDRISSNNSCPLIDHLPRIIAFPHHSLMDFKITASLEQSPPPPPPPLSLLSSLFPLSPPRQVEVESDPAKLISDDSSSEK